MDHKKSSMPMDSLMLTRKRMKKLQSKQLLDIIPLTLSNLVLFLDWKCTLPQSPTLFKLASIIWLYLPPSAIQEHVVNFQHSQSNKIIESEEISTPVLSTSSPKGDMLVMVQSVKKDEESKFEETIFILILFPSYVSNCKYLDTNTIQLDTGTHCTFWEITNIEHLTHLVMDKHGLIYFTDGEVIYKISKTDGNMYLDHFENIYIPQNDTSHITSLWRQNNDIYFSLQNWGNETNIDIYKLRPVKNKGIAQVNDNPKLARNSSNSSHSSQRSGSDTETEINNHHFKKVKSFSLQYNQRIWQLGSLRYEKKYLLAIGAAVMGNKPTLLQIGFRSDIKVLDIMNSKTLFWPKTLSDETPHSIFFHKDTKSWFCVAPVMDKESDNKYYWMQFKFNKEKTKIIWQRLIEIPCGTNEGEWLYYDSTRDVMVGYKGMDLEKNEYIFKYLCDVSKHLCIGPVSQCKMHRMKDWAKVKRKSSKKDKGGPKLQLNKAKKRKKKGKKKKKKVDQTGCIKPSFAHKSKSNKRNEAGILATDEDVMD